MLRLEITLPPQIALDLDSRKVRAVLRSAGSEIAALARRKVRQSTGAGKTYYGAEKGKHRASLPGQPPASWTGQLASSISTRVFRGGDGEALMWRRAQTAALPEVGVKSEPGPPMTLGGAAGVRLIIWCLGMPPPGRAGSYRNGRPLRCRDRRARVARSAGVLTLRRP